MGKTGNRSQAHRLGSVVISGVLTAMIVGDASATPILETAGTAELKGAIAAIEKGDGGSAIDDLHNMTASGNAEAGYLLGSIWHKGLGVSRDFAKARDAYSAAAFLGNPKAMNELGLLYRDGLGVVADPIEAVAWFRVAAEYNLTNAIENRDTLESDMVDRDRAAGRALALRRELEIDLLSRDKLGKPPKVPTRVAQSANTRDIALAMLRQESEARDAAPQKNETADIAVPTEEPAPQADQQLSAPFLVQIGVFAKAESVRRIRDEAEGLGLPVQEDIRDVNGKKATRLTAGPFETENAAKEAAAKLDSALKVKTRVMPATS
ncbi:hypothetical protein EOI86_04780 [Hwanghaeella grinnelliae]|uniref:SPOR domain-containing protein n=1 Tax=Hwanghaeella grinnelliae TaxID=2500179 RepID=A0A437QVS8_9PROT|nr:SPOR domain-containing protein [Hwanghaeella grinnelliae]RVU38598.1 hypothetical protein EOI86_04780 [Hwanghaeella grinnelliae]